MSQQALINAAQSTVRRLCPAGCVIGVHIRFAAPLMQIQTYPRDWIERYGTQGYALRDPTVAWAFSATGVCRWSALPVPDTFGIMEEAKQYGLRYGVVISHGAIESRTIAAFAHDTREVTDSEIEILSDTVRRLHQALEPPESLTKAQQEALRCVAEGDRHAAAAAKLGITESAFKARLSSARERLNARTTAEALQRARDYRLL